jgi:hypothetical protein
LSEPGSASVKKGEIGSVSRSSIPGLSPPARAGERAERSEAVSLQRARDEHHRELATEERKRLGRCEVRCGCGGWD